MSPNTASKNQSLRADWQAALETVQPRNGAVRSFVENCLILTAALEYRLSYLEEQNVRPSDTNVASWMARHFHIAERNGQPTCAFELLKHFDETGEVAVTLDDRATKDRTSIRQLSPVHLAEIEKFVTEAHSTKPKRVTAASIQKHLSEDQFVVTRAATSDTEEEREKIYEGISVKTGVIKYAMKHFLGYKWGRIKGKTLRQDAKRPNLIRQYLVDISNALELERAGTHKIVYLDESYINQNIAPNYTYLKADGDGRIPRVSGRGAWLSILVVCRVVHMLIDHVLCVSHRQARLYCACDHVRWTTRDVQRTRE